MPYTPPDAALNLPAVDLAALRRQMGPPPWRQPLVASAAMRCVLSEWPAGFSPPTHWHPRATETFHILAGTAVFRFGGEVEDRVAGPGTLLMAAPGVAHTISVPGPQPLLMLVTLTPNEDAPDETAEGGG
jgi:mannose-6-phosphate isomerase-like protein (cupin superfamily)